ncbi:MAG: phosphatidylethanolamine-binding protein [Clostridia bacterium]|nr:phosphatidylethanolamine-binding protein [Clostridia bacterium]
MFQRMLLPKKTAALIAALLFCMKIISLAAAEEPPAITVTSESITPEGRLITTTAANRGPNKPRGQNLSPQLTFDPVEGASLYAVYMFDMDANWLHFAVTDVTETCLSLGLYSDKKQYVGPYPPKGKDHHYRIEVFALQAVPDKPAGKMNASNNYQKITDSLDISGGQPGNILRRGEIIGLYRNGDNTVAAEE